MTPRHWLRTLGVLGVLATSLMPAATAGPAGVIRFVAPSGDDQGGANDCTFAGDPCRTITHAVTQAAPGDTLSLGSGTFAEAGTVSIDLNLAVEGQGQGVTIVDGQDLHRVFRTTGGSVAFRHLSIVRGAAPAGEPGATGGHGGGILGLGALLELDSVTMSENRAGDGGEGSGTGNGGDGGSGGAIYTESGLTVTSSTFSQNAAGHGGFAGAGGYGGRGGDGGAIATDITLDITTSTLSGNAAGNGGDGNGPGSRGGDGGDGGAIFMSAGSSTVTLSTLDGNSAGAAGDGGDGDISFPFVSGGDGGDGGAIFMSFGIITVTLSTLDGNSAGAAGDGGDGGISFPFGSGGGAGGCGGAIFNEHGSTFVGTSTLSGNSGGPGGNGGDGADVGGEGGRGGNGGTICTSPGVETVVTNSTLTDGTARSGGDGGNGGEAGFHGGDGGRGGLLFIESNLTVTHSTLTGGRVGAGGTGGTGTIIGGNDGQDGSGGAVEATVLTHTLRSSLFDDNGGVAACVGSFGDDGSNLSNPLGNGCPGPTDDDLMILPLADNGGPTLTRALDPASPAVDLILPGDCLVSADQRSVSRPKGGGCEVGAFELGTQIPSLSTTASPDVDLGGAVFDTASLSDGAWPTGEISFDLYGPDDADCSGPPTYSEVVTVDALNGDYSSAPFAPAAAGTYRFIAAYSGDGLNDPVAGACGNPGESVTVNPVTDLGITKTDGASDAVPGESVVYTLVASNAGPSADPAAAVADTFPAVLSCTWTSVATGGATGNSSTSGDLADVLSMPAGSSVTYTVTCDIDPDATGMLANTATILASILDLDPGNDAATDTDTLTPRADLLVTKTDGLTTANPGDPVTYTITVANGGPSDAPGTTASDTFPAALGPVSWTCGATPGSSCAATGAGDLAETVDLAAGGSVVFTATGTLDPSFVGSLSNTANGQPPAGVTEVDPANNSATDTTTVSSPSAVSGSKTVSGSFQVGGSITYSIALVNASSQAQLDNPGHEFVDALPMELTLLAASATAGTATLDTALNTVYWDGVIAGGGGVDLTIEAVIHYGTDGTTISNQGTVLFDADGDGSNESSTPTDDPDLAGDADPTAFRVLTVLEIPTLDQVGLLILALSIAIGALFSLGALRKRGGETP